MKLQIHGGGQQTLVIKHLLVYTMIDILLMQMELLHLMLVLTQNFLERLFHLKEILVETEVKFLLLIMSMKTILLLKMMLIKYLGLGILLHQVELRH